MQIQLSPELIFNTVMFVSSGTLAVITVTWNVGRQFRAYEEKIDKRFEEIQEAHAQEMKRIYERFDDFKDSVKDEYVCQKTCNLIHGQSSMALGEVKGAIQELNRKFDAFLLRQAQEEKA